MNPPSTSDPKPSPSDGLVASPRVRIAILGCGVSGLCMGIQLKKAGIHDFTIYEKADTIGGTWRDNTYPGLACDVPSHLYSFSFEPNPDWSHVYSAGWEIQQYLEHCARKYDLYPHIRFNSEIVEARFGDGLWRLRNGDGEELTANVVITGMGALHNPNYPDIPGLETFHGTRFHSARWDHGHDLTGRRVAVIGSAASAVQIVPEIAPKTDRLYVFQRTPNWIRPRLDRAYSEKRKRRFRRYPWLEKLHRWTIYWRMEVLFPVFLKKGPANRQARRICLNHLKTQIADPVLQRALTPDYAPGCKRILVSDDFYPALERGNVELVTSPIERVTANGIVTDDGKERAIDTIVLATGFHVTKLLAPMTVTGRDGLTLNEAWKDGIEAHRTVAVPGFPNFFMLLGPNSGLGHNSIIFMTEVQVRYVTQCIRAIVDHDLCCLEPKKAAADRFNTALRKDMKKTIWESGCNSWYQDEYGRVVALWPHSTVRYWLGMRRVDFSEYERRATP